MARRVFFDTNVLIHAQDADEPSKRSRAHAVLRAELAGRTATFSTQVLQEYYVNVVKRGISPDLARRQVRVFARHRVVQVTPELILAAIDLHRQDSLSFWDALIVKAASVGGCAVLYTEDLSHGQVIDGVRVVNPFQG